MPHAKRTLFTALALLSFVALAGANIGVFEGEGQTIELAGTAEVRLVEEDVTITLGRGPLPFDGSLHPRTLDRADFDCRFVLENLAEEPVEIRVGFPLTAQRFEPGMLDSAAPVDAVFFYRFLARDAGTTYPVEFRPADRERKLSSVFLWTMTFAPGERKTLRVAYEMPVSAGLSPTVKDRGNDTEWPRPWMGALTAALGEGVGYVVRTGGTWAGKIDRATFRIEAGHFERWLTLRGWSEDSGDRPGALSPLLHRDLEPEGWREEDGALVLTRRDWKPTKEEDISVVWRLCALPRTAAAMRAFLAKAGPDRWSAGDLKTLRAIVLATEGVAPADAAARAFVERQVWYEPGEEKTKADVSSDVRAALAVVDDAIAEAEGGGSAAGKAELARRQMKEIGAALELHYLSRGRYPETLAALTKDAPDHPGGYLDEVPSDPWGHGYVYRPEAGRGGAGFVLFSAGPDGKEGTADDLKHSAE